MNARWHERELQSEQDQQGGDRQMGPNDTSFGPVYYVAIQDQTRPADLLPIPNDCLPEHVQAMRQPKQRGL